MIAAAGEDNAIGQNNELLWHLPNDFKHFKRLTTGHTIVMGRKTFESFPRPLPKRFHIVITRDRHYSIPFENCLVVHSFTEALKVIEGKELVFIIGGGEIYRLGEPYADTIELTRVHASFPEADTFFPELDQNKWELVQEDFHDKDEKHSYAFTFMTFKRQIHV